jgi:hypothetical protein
MKSYVWCIIVLALLTGLIVLTSRKESYAAPFTSVPYEHVVTLPLSEGQQFTMVPSWGEDDEPNLSFSNSQYTLAPEALLADQEWDGFTLSTAGNQYTLLTSQNEDMPRIGTTYREGQPPEYTMRPPTSYRTSGLNEFCVRNSDCKPEAPYCDSNGNKCSVLPSF